MSDFLREKARESYRKVMERRKAILATLKGQEEAQSKLSPEERESIRKRNEELALEVKKDNPVNTAPILGGTGMFGEGGRVIHVFPQPVAGGGRAGEETEEESQQAAEDAQGDAGVQARRVEEQQRAEGHQQGAGAGDRLVGVGSVSETQEPKPEGSRGEQEVWVARRYEAQSKEALAEIIPADAKAVTYKKLWTAWALVRRE